MYRTNCSVQFSAMKGSDSGGSTYRRDLRYPACDGERLEESEKGTASIVSSFSPGLEQVGLLTQLLIVHCPSNLKMAKAGQARIPTSTRESTFYHLAARSNLHASPSLR